MELQHHRKLNIAGLGNQNSSIEKDDCCMSPESVFYDLEKQTDSGCKGNEIVDEEIRDSMIALRNRREKFSNRKVNVDAMMRSSEILQRLSMESYNTENNEVLYGEAKLHVLQNLWKDMDEDDEVCINRSTLQKTFHDVEESVFQEYEIETGKFDKLNILMDVCIELDIEKEKKLKFIFDIFDTTGTGFISKNQIVKLLKSIFLSAKLQAIGTNFENLASLLFHKCEQDESKRITYHEFKSVFYHYIGNDDNEAISRNKIMQSINLKNCVQDFWDQNYLRIIWLIFYFVLNMIAFGLKWTAYDYDSVAGWGIKLATGSAQVCKLNFLLVLLPMCRLLVNTMKSINILWRFIPLDDHIEFHKLSGIVCCLAGIIHSAAHVSNLIYLYILSTPEDYQKSIFSTIPGMENQPIPFRESLIKLPIWTGILLLIITFISFPFAAFPKYRQGNFNLFWYSHMLFGPFLLLNVIHGMKSWLATSSSYWWICLPLLMYLVERRYRFGKSFTDPVRIVRTEILDRTVALYLEKPKRFHYKPGMYLYLNVPKISNHEWHPFTISSSPVDPYISLHIQNVGDWTGALHEIVKTHLNMNVPCPFVHLDGPIGAPTSNYTRYKTILLIGGGIGVTPFASILKDLVHMWNEYRCKNCQQVQHPRSFRIQKIYFHWTTRAQDSLRWFEETMNQITAMDIDNIVESHHYLTSVQDTKENAALKLFQQFAHSETGCDILSGLNSKQVTHLGRANWDNTLLDIKKKHPGETIGVFFCGPHSLEKILSEKCAQYSSDPDKYNGTYFDYHSEKFS